MEYEVIRCCLKDNYRVLRLFKDFSAHQLCKNVHKSRAEDASPPDPRQEPATGADILNESHRFRRVDLLPAFTHPNI